MTILLIGGTATVGRGFSIPVPELEMKAEITISPRALPKREMAPIALELSGAVSMRSGGRPPAAEEVNIHFDKGIAVDAEGLPACGARRIRTLDVEQARRACADSIVGSGTAHLGLETPEGALTSAPAKLTLYNNGRRNGRTRVLVHGVLAGEHPTPILFAARIAKHPQGRLGLEAIARLPEIAGGNDYLLDFDLEIGRRFRLEGERRSYLTARCWDDHLINRMEMHFKDGTTLSGSTVVPCKEQ